MWAHRFNDGFTEDIDKRWARDECVLFFLYIYILPTYSIGMQIIETNKLGITW